MPTRPRRRVTAALAAVISLALFAAACGGDDSDSSGGSGSDPTSEGSSAAVDTAVSDGGQSDDGAIETVDAATASAFDSLDPIMGRNLEIYYSIYDFLTLITPEGDVVPGLATEWEKNEDATVWTFKIRTDATFWNGEPVTARDVVWNYQTTMDTEASLNHIYVTSVATVEATADDTIVFTHSTPYTAWDREVSLIPIASQKVYEEIGAEAFASTPMGSGPYEVVGWDGAGTITLKAFADHWNGAPPIENVILHSIPDETTRLTGLQSGSLDVALLNSNQVPDAEATASLEVKSIPSNRAIHLGFNHTVAPLDNPDVRRAIGMAIDVPSIIATLYHELATPVGQLVAPVTWGYDESIEPTAYDPDGAKALLEEAGYAGESVVMHYPTSGVVAQPVQLAQAIAGYLTEAGINVELQGSDPADYSQQWFNQELTGVYLFSFQPSIMDAGLIADFGYGPNGPSTIDDPRVDELVAEQHAEADDTARQADFTELWTLSQDNAYYAPLFNDTYNYVTVNDQVSVTPRAEGYMVLYNLNPPTQE